MDTPEPGSAAEDEEEKVPEVRPRTRSNPEGAEDRGQPGVGNRSEGEGEAASAGHSPQASPGQGSAWHGPAEVQVKTPRVNCPEKVIICLDLAEEMALPKLESFNGSQGSPQTHVRFAAASTTWTLSCASPSVSCHQCHWGHWGAIGVSWVPPECSGCHRGATRVPWVSGVPGVSQVSLGMAQVSLGVSQVPGASLDPQLRSGRALQPHPAEDRAAGDRQCPDHPPSLRGENHPGVRAPTLPAPVLWGRPRQEVAAVPLFLLRCRLHPQRAG
ncbi:BRISC and BRCA1-A complex member 1 isoform X2 [Cinclus cinclus]|uniref:BRISC and BRCA1-A complex member 1 isoform X2 n=1 Tax=Cinclus cinclus TaxID=127875 RepID=UPI002E1024B5